MAKLFGRFTLGLLGIVVVASSFAAASVVDPVRRGDDEGDLDMAGGQFRPDHVPTVVEVQLGMDPLAYDTDDDGMDDGFELLFGTDWGVADADLDPDGDGCSTGFEYRFQFDSYDPARAAKRFPLDPLTYDSDGDGLGDCEDPFPRDDGGTRSILGGYSDNRGRGALGDGSGGGGGGNGDGRGLPGDPRSDTPGAGGICVPGLDAFYGSRGGVPMAEDILAWLLRTIGGLGSGLGTPAGPGAAAPLDAFTGTGSGSGSGSLR